MRERPREVHAHALDGGQRSGRLIEPALGQLHGLRECVDPRPQLRRDRIDRDGQRQGEIGGDRHLVEQHRAIGDHAEPIERGEPLGVGRNGASVAAADDHDTLLGHRGAGHEMHEELRRVRIEAREREPVATAHDQPRDSQWLRTGALLDESGDFEQRSAVHGRGVRPARASTRSNRSDDRPTRPRACARPEPGPW